MHPNLIWIDLEFSGLDLQKNVILEIATLVTNSELEILEVGPTYAIQQPVHILEGMDNWNTTHHNNSGLVELVKKSKITESQAEKETLDFLSQYTKPQQSPLCGNSIHQDRRFLEQHMPHLFNYFHYRNIDVSTIKELASRWKSSLKHYVKSGKHRALDDIKESIKELKHYRTHFLTQH